MTYGKNWEPTLGGFERRVRYKIDDDTYHFKTVLLEHTAKDWTLHVNTIPVFAHRHEASELAAKRRANRILKLNGFETF